MDGEVEWASEAVAALLPDGDAFAAAYAALPEWRRRKCDAFRFSGDRRRSVAAWLLLERLLRAKGVAAAGLEVVENAFGRPAFAGDGAWRFNLSHSGGRVMAVIGRTPVGCDVEKIGRARMEIVEGCLAAGERDYVLSFADATARDRAFCRVWVRKECYVKAVGRGLDVAFDSFSAAPGEFPAGWSCREFDFGDGHLGAVCLPS